MPNVPVQQSVLNATLDFIWVMTDVQHAKCSLILRMNARSVNKIRISVLYVIPDFTLKAKTELLCASIAILIIVRHVAYVGLSWTA